MEYEKCIVLEAVYNDSEPQTDYFHRDARLKEWFIAKLEGKKVTEAKLRKALKTLPKWLQEYDWRWEKGEKYSMSDHYYGQLRMDRNTGVYVKKTYGGKAHVRFLLKVSYISKDEMENPEQPPQSLEEVRRFIEERERKQELKALEMREKAEEAQAEVFKEAVAIIDGNGFHVLTEEDKKEMIQKWKRKDRSKITFYI